MEDLNFCLLLFLPSILRVMNNRPFTVFDAILTSRQTREKLVFPMKEDEEGRFQQFIIDISVLISCVGRQ